MDDKLKAALEALRIELKGKNDDQVKAAIAAFEAKNIDAIAAQVKTVRESIEAEVKTAKDLADAELKALQDHANALDVKLQKALKGGGVGKKVDELKGLITANFEKIKTVRKGNSFTKAVGDMTLGANLTGDQPRVYQSNVAMVPTQPINFADLITSIVIAGGTYTFPREGTSEGGIGVQTEGTNKSQIDYDFTMVDVNTDFLAGFAVYSKKMANNLPFLENFLPQALRRDYFKAENALFYADLVVNSKPSTVIAGNIVERIIAEQVSLMADDYFPNAIVVSPQDYGTLLLTAGATGGTAGTFSLPGSVSVINGMISVNGLRVVVASWMPADKYIIGDWTQANKIVTQGLGVEFFEQDSDNVRKNNITARVEAQVALAVQRTFAFVNGDFTVLV